jgi:hypothetical protein
MPLFTCFQPSTTQTLHVTLLASNQPGSAFWTQLLLLSRGYLDRQSAANQHYVFHAGR